jgi:hypothetical protein
LSSVQKIYIVDLLDPSVAKKMIKIHRANVIVPGTSGTLNTIPEIANNHKFIMSSPKNDKFVSFLPVPKSEESDDGSHLHDTRSDEKIKGKGGVSKLAHSPRYNIQLPDGSNYL